MAEYKGLTLTGDDADALDELIKLVEQITGVRPAAPRAVRLALDELLPSMRNLAEDRKQGQADPNRIIGIMQAVQPPRRRTVQVDEEAL